MNPKIWGPCFWNALFYLAKVMNASKFYKLLHLVYYVLPCVEICRPNYKRHLKTLSRNGQKSWLRKIHKKTATTKLSKLNHHNYIINAKKTIKLVKKDAHDFSHETSKTKVNKFAHILKSYM